MASTATGEHPLPERATAPRARKVGSGPRSQVAAPKSATPAARKSADTSTGAAAAIVAQHPIRRRHLRPLRASAIPRRPQPPLPPNARARRPGEREGAAGDCT
eukprot:scaffold978_cov392-Prasinococcus_capsulatus_cf.AAC.29